MARLLEDVVPGTPVVDRQGTAVGEIRAVYASGAGRGAEFLLVFWTARGEETLVAADEAADVTENSVVLMGSGYIYETLPAFDPQKNPALHRL